MEPSPISSENLHYLSNMRPDLAHKAVDIVGERVEVDAHPYAEHSEDFKWRHEAVMLLCSLYRAKKEQFVSGFVKKRDLWAEVAAEMVSRGFPVNYIACEKKWHNLCATFRKLKEYNRYSTKKRKCWAYYETMEEILAPDMSSQGDSMNHVRCQSPENSCHTPSALAMNQPQMPMYGKNLWPIPYRQQVDTPHPDGRPRSCEQDITSMLSVTLEENNHSQSSMSNGSHSGMGLSTSICIDDFKWTHNSVMLLCSMYIARKEQFQSGTVKKRDLWSDIAQQMNQEGFPVTFTGCEKKWHNLIATYKKVVLYNKKKTWPYLRIFQKILEEQQGNRMYPTSADYGSLAGSSYNKDCPENALCRKITVKQDMSLLTPDEQALYGDTLNNSNDSMDDFKWTHDSVISLCTLYKERRDDFQSNTVRKRDLWTEVANEMNIQGYCVSWVHCEKKWYNLYATYKKVTDHSRKRVRIWSTWPYLQLFQDIFCKEGMVREPPPPGTMMNHSYENEAGAPHEVCSPSPSNSDRTCDLSQEQQMVEHRLPSKRQCMESPPVWFLEYCERQREQEERRHLENEQRHRELMEAVIRGNDAVKDLSDNLKIFLNKCL